ncbi:MAG TPA: flagellar hook-basal body complex protein [Sedimentisphaerales bacterium]|nr:flagellar hook-basal body complex protein [Sedimentisphaerales bacterium]
MSLSLSIGVTGLQAHQQMLDVAGNNLANINTTAFKAGRIVFSQLLSETIKNASQPTTTIGGTNPQQMGSGVGIAGITSNMTQGNIVNTGNPLDLAIEGQGYFVLTDGAQNLYTRAGAFGVDANSNLVDPSTGYLVQRIGSEGEADGFQAVGDSRIRVPYDAALPASATSQMIVRGNLSADAIMAEPQVQKLRSNITYTVGSLLAGGTTQLGDLDQYTGTLTAGVITFSGYKPDGTSFAAADPAVDLTMNIDGATTINDILTWLNTDEGTAAVDEVQTITTTDEPDGGTYTLTFMGETTAAIAADADDTAIEDALELLSTIGDGNVSVAGGPIGAANPIVITFAGDLAGQDVSMITIDASSLTTGGGASATPTVAETTTGRAVQGVLGGDATATLTNGQIVITDTALGYSKSDLRMSYSGDGTLTMPGYFEYLALGGDEVQNVNITIYDSQGGAHVLSGAFVRTETDNTWDMVLNSVTGNISEITMANRRIDGIQFNAIDGSYAGLDAGIGDTANFIITFVHDTLNPQSIAVDLGTVGKFDGLTQFATGVAGTSNAVVREQDGYGSGTLSSVSINNEGLVIGLFSNGVKKNIATIQIALFQNAAGLKSEGSGYYTSSANSGDAVATKGVSGGAGAIRGGTLEASNVNEANEFIAMIKAQNGYQANARTIKVANDMLQELTNIIR